MDSWLNKVYFNNPLEDYLIFVLALLLILLFKRYLSKYIASLVYRLLHKTYSTISRELFVNLLRGPIHVFLVLLVIFVSLDRMTYPRALNFKINRIPFKFIVESTVNPGNCIHLVVTAHHRFYCHCDGSQCRRCAWCGQ